LRSPDALLWHGPSPNSTLDVDTPAQPIRAQEGAGEFRATHAQAPATG
ncbi:hypothetical protein BC938DRAFT_478009, partial [Jimgerdemannia flammicorona]